MFDRDYEKDEQVQIEAWSNATDCYTGNDCPNCGRNRLLKCANGKTRCEKCNWVLEDSEYCPIRD
jgi:ribosomal protein L37AE/L43A